MLRRWRRHGRRFPCIASPATATPTGAVWESRKFKTPTIGGVPFYLTHGHLHHVKTGRRDLLLAAREAGVQAVLYGHTHIPMCGREPDGLWVLNPGTCAGPGGTVGLIRLENGRVEDMRILRDSDLEV